MIKTKLNDPKQGDCSGKRILNRNSKIMVTQNYSFNYVSEHESDFSGGVQEPWRQRSKFAPPLIVKAGASISQKIKLQDLQVWKELFFVMKDKAMDSKIAFKLGATMYRERSGKLPIYATDADVEAPALILTKRELLKYKKK